MLSSKPSSSSSKKKKTPTLNKVVNYDMRVKYLELKRNKFWHLAEETRRLYAAKNPNDVISNDFNDAYIKMNNVPPISAFRIKERASYSYHKNNAFQWKQNKPIREFPPNATVQMITEEDFKKIHRCINPVELLTISEENQCRFNFTIEEKKGRPMYEMYNYSDATEDEEDDEKSTSSDEQHKKKMKYTYTPHRIVAPPEYPFSYYRLKKNQRCGHCHQVGKNCHNVRYGPYLAASLARFHREHAESYNEHDAVRHFLEGYRWLSEFEDGHLEQNKIKARSEDVVMPECITYDSLVFALNSVEWTVMWGLNETKSGKVKSKNDDSTSKIDKYCKNKLDVNED